ncbi:DUF932 domain-containing protein [Undibacterium sp. SXout7W]|uniref:DUF932 domain-containing protein n=1 Tax=Undibacterium sp. SXout7W TaxID=3413049 RepID=UPI003BEFE2E4
MQLASKFHKNAHVLRSMSPLSNDQIRAVVPSIFADDKHGSRSDRYTYVSTGEILDNLRDQGFSPFMVCQSRVRDDGKREHAKHMVRMRHAGNINAAEANEIILLNSHDGSSSYQLFAGCFRFVCQNGLVCGETLENIRIPHKGEIVGDVIEGAFRVVKGFERADEEREGMKALTLNQGEMAAFAKSALQLKYDPELPAPITENQLLRPKRREDSKTDLWTVFNTVQENIMGGGISGRSANGNRMRTRAVEGISQNIQLNRAMWTLAEEMRKLKA